MRRGLTLIESLILIALTALLLSMILPSLTQTQALARTMECRSNLHQMALARKASFGGWGESAYDLNDNDPWEYGRDGGGGRPGPGGSPTRVGPRGSLQSLTGEGFSEWMEFEAHEQPLLAGLVCYEGHRYDRNSYGMVYIVRGQPFERFSSMNVIMGCSDYRVVDVPSNFALRHQDRVNFLFGDAHVSTRSPDEIFTSASMRAESNRLPARPLGN